MFDEKFGFRAGNQSGGGAAKREATETGGAGDVLKRFAGSPAADKLTERFQLGGIQLPLELEIETETRKREGVGEEKLGLQAGGGNSVFGEVAGRRFQDGKKLHAAGAFSSRRRLRWSAAKASTRSPSFPSITCARSCEVKPMRWSVSRFWGKL